MKNSFGRMYCDWCKQRIDGKPYSTREDSGYDTCSEKCFKKIKNKKEWDKMERK